MIQENLENVKKRIAEACEKAGRDKNEVTLIAVSKTKPVNLLKEAYDLGIRDFGENRVQELLEKIPEMPSDIRWHMIGHLQRNKVKDIVGKVALIHSVDSLRLAEEISKEASKKEITAHILLEVNVSGEKSKFGVTADEAVKLVEAVSNLPSIHIQGLMTVAPIQENAEKNRLFFHKLKQLSVDIRQKNVDNVSMDVLSMGMSGDFTAAIAEGATYVRVGTGIFGERQGIIL